MALNVNQPKSKLGFNATWSMAVGGMVGGGIFSTLGVVVGIAGAWAWLSFAAAGLIALAAGYSYVKLATHYDEGGGAFTFLRDINADGFAGSLSWVLIVGYVLTNAVYAFTFGQYLGHVVGLGPWFPRLAGIAIVVLFVGLNLRGVGEAGGVEIFLVWFKLVVLVGLAGWGLAVFMAYEGFQLLTYDYKDIETPQKTLPRAVLSAIVIVTVVYVVVALGTAMLIGGDQVVRHKEVALAIAGRRALGTVGLVIVTIAAAFSTGSAINATLFATARLANKVAEDGELPAAMDHKNAAGIPDRAVIVLGAAAAVLAAVGIPVHVCRRVRTRFLSRCRRAGHYRVWCAGRSNCNSCPYCSFDRNHPAGACFSLPTGARRLVRAPGTAPPRENGEPP
jgi:amino acid transporter